MEVDCEGCAGCCIDWRPLAAEDIDHERRGPYEPLDDEYNLVPLHREAIRGFVEEGLADALVPRLFASEDGIDVGGVSVAAIDGRPAFFVGLRSVPKPVAPFGHEPTWLSSCVFLDPTTLQCRIHNTDRYPETCEIYPGENLVLDVETECERVEAEHGGDRLLDDEPPEDATPNFGPAAIGETVFAHPDPDRIGDAITRLRDGESTRDDRAEFIAVAAASSPGTLEVEPRRYEQVRERAATTESWISEAIAEWRRRAETSAADPTLARTIETRRGATPTPGWDGSQ
ncbi:Fe-S-cluster containining protein [Halorhabdus sp. SVX81]|uniref:YkgJ family cysteine cluster protein n=1 Tax=Halorhabdus sp. SVX81 TaxID=2978283 RepID=UPI0023DCB42B|nr:YkgJ family cysteine cluster protein [Halorhabdus sp. SVX81]WEL16783.1 Fe-S-cluster containining protein [Halorhabdus sp. SVX81]